MTRSDAHRIPPGASAADALRAALAHSQRQCAQMAALQQDLLHALEHDLRAPLRHIGAYRGFAHEALCALAQAGPAGALPPATASAAAAGSAADPDPPDATPPGAPLPEALACLAAVEQSAQRLARMLAATIALLRASQAPLRPQPLALHSAVLRARAALPPGSADCAGAGRAIDWQIDPALPTLHADPQLLHELLLQLLGNAVKFTRHSAQPEIAVRPVAAAPGQLAFAVQDNGAGFDPAAAQAGELFGLFRRLHGPTPYEGLGAGLALCRAIAQRHGGRIAAAACAGAGCTVLVHWPALPGAPVLPAAETPSVDEPLR